MAQTEVMEQIAEEIIRAVYFFEDDVPDSVFRARHLPNLVEFLNFVAKRGFRRDFKWLVSNGILDELAFDLYRSMQAVNYL